MPSGLNTRDDWPFNTSVIFARNNMAFILPILLPGLPEVTGLGLIQPTLDILARRAGMVTRRDGIHIHRLLTAHRAGFHLQPQIGRRGNVSLYFDHADRRDYLAAEWLCIRRGPVYRPGMATC